MNQRIQTIEGAAIRRVAILAGRADVELRQGGDALVFEGPLDASAERQGDTVTIRLPRPRGWLRLAAERLAVTLPGSVAACRVETTGNVELRDLRCECTVEVRAGNVHSDGGRGHLRVRSGAGNVEVRDHEGEVEVDSGAGDVDVMGGRLAALSIRTGAGDVRFQGWLARQGQITTGAGSIDVRPLTDGNADLEVRSGFGDITLEVTGVTGGRLELQTGAGSIHDASSIQVGRRGGFGLRSVDVLGPGTGVIRLATGAGRIRVLGMRPEPTPASGRTTGNPAGAPGVVAQSPAAAPAAPAPSAAPAGPPLEASAAEGAPAGQGARATHGAGEPRQEVREPEGAQGSHGARGNVAARVGAPGTGTTRPRSARDVLEALARGEIGVEEADRLLREVERGA